MASKDHGISLNNLHPSKGSTHKKKRVGRGPGSGLGKLRVAVRRVRSLVRAIRARSVLKAARCRCIAACRSAASPTSSRSAGSKLVWRRSIEHFEADEEITPELLHERGIIKKAKHDVVVLGNGEVVETAAHLGAPVHQERAREDREGRRRRAVVGRLAEVSASQNEVAEQRGQLMEKFFAAVRNMFNVPDLRRRILFTLGMLAVYRLGAHVGAPGINKDRLDQVWHDVAGTLLGVLDLFSGGNFRTISIFALGVTPYITASIILQLMTVVSPQLKKLQEEGEMGRQKINQWTRYLTVGLAGIQTSFVAHWLQVNGVGAPTWGFLLTTVLTLTTGTIFVMWLGEQITERGVGNGISLLIFAGIVIGLPRGVQQVFERVRGGDTMETLGVFGVAGRAGRDHRVHRFCRSGATKDSGQLCEASRRPAAGWRAANDDAAEDQYGRRDSGDLCFVGVVDAAEFVCGVSARSG